MLVKIKEGFSNQGRIGQTLDKPKKVCGVMWTPILWQRSIIPTWTETESIKQYQSPNETI